MLQHRLVEGEVCHDPLQLAVLLLELAQRIMLAQRSFAAKVCRRFLLAGSLFAPGDGAEIWLETSIMGTRRREADRLTIAKELEPRSMAGGLLLPLPKAAPVATVRGCQYSPMAAKSDHQADAG